MKKADIRKPIFALSLTILLSVALGYGEWVIIASKYLGKSPVVNEKKVCYIGNTYYTTVEAALTAAESNDGADTIYVIPGANPTITQDCTIATGDTLCLPYEGTTYKVELNGLKNSDPSFNNYHRATFADAEETKYLKSNVTIRGESADKTATLTVKGTLLIGGILGVGEGSYQKPTGHTVNSYSQITLDSYSYISNEGTIECRGYIKPYNLNSLNTCGFINKSGSSTTLPLVFYDYRGGSYSAACDSEGVFPFSIFDMANCHVKSTYEYGSTLKVLVHACADNTIYSPEKPAVLLSNNSGLFKLSSGSVSFRYKPSTFNITTNDASTQTTQANANKTTVFVEGNISLDSLKVDLAGKSIDSKDYYVPFSYKFDIYAKNGSTFSIQNRTKFLSGSCLTADEGSTINMNSSVVFYQKYDGHNTLADVYPNSFGPARLINNGTININSSFGGKVDTSVSGAVTKTGAGFASTVVSREVLTGTSLGAVRTYLEITTYGYCNFYKQNDGTTVDAQLIKSKTYNSILVGTSGHWLGDAGSTNVTETHGNPVDVNGCLLPSALILMADGTYRNAGDIKPGDMVISFDHEIGKFEPNVVIANIHIDQGEKMCEVVHLTFDNGKSTDFVFRHGYFDMTLNKYVYLRINNVDEYIGHEFVFVDDKLNVSKAKLIEVSTRTTMTRIVAPVTANHFNLITDHMVSMEGELIGLFNIFDYEEGSMAYDKVKMKEDIDKYGLLDYECFEQYFPKKVYDLLPLKYMAVSLGKGLITWDMFKDYYEKWGKKLIDNIK